MKIRGNERGFVITAIGTLIGVVAGLVLLFVPNSLSSSLGIGIRPNKTVDSSSVVERVEFIKDADGVLIATKTITTRIAASRDQQQHVSVWEQLRSLPVLWLALMILGGACPLVAGVMVKINGGLRRMVEGVRGDHEELHAEAKKIVKSIDAALAKIPLSLAGLPAGVDQTMLAKKVIEDFKSEMKAVQDQSTKDLVWSMRQS